VSETNQLTAQINYAAANRMPYNLVVGPNTAIEQDLVDKIQRLRTGGNIYRFDPTTGTLTNY